MRLLLAPAALLAPGALLVAGCTHTALPEAETHLAVPTRWVAISVATPEVDTARGRAACAAACAEVARPGERASCVSGTIADLPAYMGPRVLVCRLERSAR